MWGAVYWLFCIKVMSELPLLLELLEDELLELLDELLELELLVDELLLEELLELVLLEELELDEVFIFPAPQALKANKVIRQGKTAMLALLDVFFITTTLL